MAVNLHIGNFMGDMADPQKNNLWEVFIAPPEVLKAQPSKKGFEYDMKIRARRVVIPGSS